MKSKTTSSKCFESKFNSSFLKSYLYLPRVAQVLWCPMSECLCMRVAVCQAVTAEVNIALVSTGYPVLSSFNFYTINQPK